MTLYINTNKKAFTWSWSEQRVAWGQSCNASRFHVFFADCGGNQKAAVIPAGKLRILEVKVGYHEIYLPYRFPGRAKHPRYT